MAAIRNGIRVSKIAVIPAFTLLLLTVLAGAGLVLGQALKGRAAFGNWWDDKPGVRRLVLPQDLPPVSPESVGRADIVPMPAGAKPLVPDGFSVELVTSGLNVPRVIRLAPNGDLFVAESEADAVRVYRIPPGSARPAKAEVFSRGLRQPYGIAFYPLGPDPDWVYVANSDSVVRFPYKNGDLTATGKPEKIVEHIPWTHHWTRDIVFSPDGRRMFLAVGSGSNVALDMSPEPRVKGGLAAWSQSQPLGATWDTEERRADVLSFDADGKNEKIYATGLRNCSGMAVQPATGRLWGVINERDGLGDEKRTGYKVIRLTFDGKGRPTGEYEDFMTGFVVSDDKVWGRPVGVAVAKDGSLFVTEDGNGTIWRVARK